MIAEYIYIGGSGNTSPLSGTSSIFPALLETHHTRESIHRTKKPNSYMKWTYALQIMVGDTETRSMQASVFGIGSHNIYIYILGTRPSTSWVPEALSLEGGPSSNRAFPIRQDFRGNPSLFVPRRGRNRGRMYQYGVGTTTSYPPWPHWEVKYYGLWRIGGDPTKMGM